MQTDYVDLLWVHAHDEQRPYEETMRALDDLVRAGKVLYIGISDTPAWVVSAANTLAELRGWTSFVGLQIEYSLLQRTPERDLLPMAAHFGLSVVAWAPAQVATAWVSAQGYGLIPIVGARELEQIHHTLGASNVTLSREHLAKLDAVSQIKLGFPHDFLRSSGVRDLVYGEIRPRIDPRTRVAWRACCLLACSAARRSGRAV